MTKEWREGYEGQRGQIECRQLLVLLKGQLELLYVYNRFRSSARWLLGGYHHLLF